MGHKGKAGKAVGKLANSPQNTPDSPNGPRTSLVSPKGGRGAGRSIAFISALLILSGSAVASCYFDSGFQRTLCLNDTTPQTSAIDSRALAMAISFKAQNITPFKFQQSYANMMAKQAVAPLQTVLPHKETVFGNATPAQKLSNSTTVAGNRTVAIRPCQNSKENDWQAYCQSNLMGFDCFNANKETKDMIMRNMAQIRNCYYG